MSHPAQVQQFATPRAALGIYKPPTPDARGARWWINGYRASIIVWTAEEWEKLTDRPTDAQLYPCGVWCALRME